MNCVDTMPDGVKLFKDAKLLCEDNSASSMVDKTGVETSVVSVNAVYTPPGLREKSHGDVPRQSATIRRI